MNPILLFVFVSSIPVINSSYNPIPVGSVIISTTRTITVMNPIELGGNDKVTLIFTAHKNMTIVSTIFDPAMRDLYILFTNTTSETIYLCQLISVEKLDSTIYQLPISFNTSYINRLTSFSSDIYNKRIFLTDSIGTLTMFSMSGTMNTIITIPDTIKAPIRSVNFNSILNRLFIITDTSVFSCTGLDTNNLRCCQALPKADQLRTIVFDASTNDLRPYVLDERTGIYQVVMNNITDCPVALRPINTIGTYNNLHLSIYQEIYFCAGSTDNSNHYSILFIGNAQQLPRTIPFDASIVALHISYPDLKSRNNIGESCFHGITYHDYRIAVVLAAIFGTIMGIFMCFNALFCIDFFMTKRIIGDLKRQIPHNVLEDRWNRLVNEKYAKLALEIHRKKDDPPPKRKSSLSSRKMLTNDNVLPPSGRDNTYQPSNPIPKISTYIRRKSESYLGRCRRLSDENRLPTNNNTTNTPKIRAERIREDDHYTDVPENVKQSDVAKTNGELL
ncbi:unnamed protein product [Adineta steineri]|uniref:Uncharacterized protein n=1 Tax=Adineta steineri TaxID=433720 RepID=A0A814E6C2_9BILA|nr:unnamed protein product [Adineta steineri]CAF4058491.1 unnamed protein product [Adineta steineri]